MRLVALYPRAKNTRGGLVDWSRVVVRVNKLYNANQNSFASPYKIVVNGETFYINCFMHAFYKSCKDYAEHRLLIPFFSDYYREPIEALIVHHEKIPVPDVEEKKKKVSKLDRIVVTEQDLEDEFKRVTITESSEITVKGYHPETNVILAQITNTDDDQLHPLDKAEAFMLARSMGKKAILDKRSRNNKERLQARRVEKDKTVARKKLLADAEVPASQKPLPQLSDLKLSRNQLRREKRAPELQAQITSRHERKMAAQARVAQISENRAAALARKKAARLQRSAEPFSEE